MLPLCALPHPVRGGEVNGRGGGNKRGNKKIVYEKKCILFFINFVESCRDSAKEQALLLSLLQDLLHFSFFIIILPDSRHDGCDGSYTEGVA